MWTRSLLKQNAWKNLKGYYWPALGVTVLASILGANSGGGGFGGGGGGGSFSNYTDQYSSSGGEDVDPAVLVGIFVAVMAVVIVAWCFAMAYLFFVGMPTKCGECKYFVTARNGDQNFSHLFDNFKGGNYKPTVKAMFFYWGEIFLWSLLFIIPGVIKSYEYALVPYLIAENPRMDSKRAKEISKQTMDGEKINYWVLHLSFIGWYLLGVMACGIGVIFVQPYQLATDAEFYMCMRAKMLSFGYTTEEELTGGFYNGFGDNGGSGYMDGGQNPYNNPQGFQTPFNAQYNSQTGYSTPPVNPNDQYNGQMPGIGDDQPNDPNNPYNN